jgi:hypothetical protein
MRRLVPPLAPALTCRWRGLVALHASGARRGTEARLAGGERPAARPADPRELRRGCPSARHSHPTTWLKLSAHLSCDTDGIQLLSERPRGRGCVVSARQGREPSPAPAVPTEGLDARVCGPRARYLTSATRLQRRTGRRRGHLTPQFEGIPEAGGAGCVPVYGVIGEPATGVVVSGPPWRRILPPVILPSSAPEKPP